MTGQPSETSIDIRDLLTLRSCVAQAEHRLRSGSPPDIVKVDVAQYLLALRAVLRESASQNLIDWLREKHSILCGPSEFRSTIAGVIAAHEDNRLRFIQTDPEQIIDALSTAQSQAETIEDPIARIAHAYLRLLLIHPFDDGNGRLARLYVGHAFQQVFDLNYVFDLTSVMSTSMSRYNSLINAVHDPIQEQNWQRYFAGLVSAEVAFISRLEMSVEGLNRDSLRALHHITSTTLDRIESKQPVGKLGIGMSSVDRILRSL